MSLENEDIQRLKEIFVTREECRTTTEEFGSNFSKELVKIAVIETKLSQITWLLTAVTGGIITMLIKLFFGG